MFPPTRHKTDSRNPSSQGTEDKRQKDRAYVHFANDDIRLSDDPNLKYTDETNAYTTVSTRGHFTPNPRITSYSITSPGRPHNSPTPSDSVWPRELTSEKPVGDVLGMQDRGRDVGVPLSARSYELSPSRKRQSSPRQTQGPLADKIGKGDENSVKETPSRDLFTNSTTMVQYITLHLFYLLCYCYLHSCKYSKHYCMSILVCVFLTFL